MEILKKVKKYFKTTPRKQVLEEWKKVKKECENIESPTII